MREIKFRVWHRKQKCWTYFTLVDLIIGRAKDQTLAYENWCEYTGLKDKNGQEIYEGDILEAKVYVPGCENKPKFWPRIDRHEIKYERIYDSEYYSIYTMGFNIHMDEEERDRHEIIGNIHENPKLLEAV